MALNPLAPVTDYQSMLNRIFWFTSASALAGVWALRTHSPAIDAALREIDLAVVGAGFKALPTTGGYLLPALAVGIAARVFRLHGRISDMLGIRECFDIEVILAEMADQLGMDLGSVEHERLRGARHRLMRTTFYPYVSGSRPVIDDVLVHQALEAWSWFWVALEAIAVGVLTGFGLVALSAYRVGMQTLLAALAFTAVMPTLRGQCRRYAIAQVREILADPQREAAVRAAFAELLSEQRPARIAA